MIMSMMLALSLAKPNAKLYVIANVIFSVNCFSSMLEGDVKLGHTLNQLVGCSSLKIHT